MLMVIVIMPSVAIKPIMSSVIILRAALSNVVAPNSNSEMYNGYKISNIESS